MAVIGSETMAGGKITLNADKHYLLKPSSQVRPLCLVSGGDG